jgi:hypothetical protein
LTGIRAGLVYDGFALEGSFRDRSSTKENNRIISQYLGV